MANIILEKNLQIEISTESFNYYFQKSIGDLLNENKALNTKKPTYENFNKNIINCYYQLLNNIHCVYDPKKYKTIDFKQTKYYKYVQANFVDELADKPICFILVLLLLLDREFVRNKYIEIYQKKSPNAPKNTPNSFLIADINSDIFPKYIGFLKGLLNFTDEIIAGIGELAKNIIEHSEHHTGKITIKTTAEKVLSTEDIQGEDYKSLWKDYFVFVESKLNKKPPTYLNISIADTGTIGIIETSLNNMNWDNGRGIDENIRKEDINIIENGVKDCNNDKTQEANFLFQMYFNKQYPTLKRQVNNAYKGIGIYRFTIFINQNDGLFNVQTNKYGSRNETINFTYYNEKINGQISNPRAFGTTYKIILPIKTKDQSEISPKIPELKVPILAKGVYEKMLPLDVNNGKSIALTELNNYYLLQNTIWDYITHENKILVFSLKNKENNNLPFNISSIIYRNIYRIFENNSTISAIVIKDATQSLIANLFNLYAIYSEDKTYFFPNSKMLLLLTEKKKGKKYRDGVVIAGNSIDECKRINQYVSDKNGYFKVISGNYLTMEELKDDERENLEKHILFSSGQLIRLGFYEEGKGYAYFENPAKRKLQKTIDAKHTIGYDWKHTHLKIGSKLHLDDFVYGKKMFQRSGEASNFAFSIARNIFENIMQEKWKSLQGTMVVDGKDYVSIAETTKDDSEQTVYTLVGYGYYSELLVSRTCDFIRYLFERCNLKEQIIKFEYIIIKDEEEIKFSRYIHNFQKRKNNATLEQLIIIVPISSTLTTCLKIENAFYKVIKEKEEKEKSKIYDKDRFKVQSLFYTIVVVGDEIDIEEIQKHFEKKSNTKIGKNESDIRFKAIENVWKNVNAIKKEIITENREVKKERPEEAERKNKYNIYIKSKWKLPENCEYCFPQEPIQERPLFVTDKVSVTPSLIFDHPKWYKSNNEPYFFFKQACIEPDTDLPVINKIDWVHYIGDNNKHFNYYLHYCDILQENEIKLGNWANKLRKDFSAERDSNVLLIAPDKSENGTFIHLINRQIFDDKAEIIRFDRHSDHYSNFDKFFRDKIKWAKTIYFVDNLMFSGKTFLSIDELLKVSQKTKRKKRIKGIFCLINRMDYSCYHTIIGKLKDNNSHNGDEKFYSFIQLNVSESILIPCPLCDEKKKYEDLKNSVSLDCLKQYYIEKEIPYFEEIDKENLIEHKLPYFSLNKKNENTLLKTVLIHFLNRAFAEYPEDKNQENDKYDFIYRLKVEELPNFDAHKEPTNHLEYFKFNDFVEKFREYIEEQKHCNIDKNIIDDITFKANLIKVVSSQPFKKHRGVYISVFYWVLNDLIVAAKTILGNQYKFAGIYENINTQSNFDILNASPVEDWSLYINTVKYLRVLIKYAGSLNIAYLLHADFLAAINELNKCFKNSKLAERMPDEYKEMGNPFENFKLFCAAHIVRSLYKNEQRAIKFEENINRILEEEKHDTSFLELLILENTSIIRQTMENLKDTTDLEDKDDGEDLRLNDYRNFANAEKFFNYETLKNTYKLKKLLIGFLEIEESSKKESPIKFDQEATEVIEIIASIVKYTLSKDNRNEGGGLLLYKYQDIEPEENNYIIIANVGNSSLENLYSSMPHNTFATNILKGKEYLSEKGAKYTWTNFTVHFENDKWIGQDGKNYDIMVDSNTAKRILFIRISKFDIDEKKKLKGDGVFVFYYNQAKGEYNSVHKIRFVHTLRNEINDYFEKRYRNNSFRNWIESEKFLNAPDHNYYNILSKLRLCKNNEERYEFFHSMLMVKKEIHGILQNKTINEKDIKQWNLKQQIEFYCLHTFDDLKPEIVCDDDFKIYFSESLLRHIMFEYLLNVEKEKDVSDIKITVSQTIEHNGFKIEIKNKCTYMNTADKLLARQEILKAQGYFDASKVKGLYLNYRLLKAINCPSPSIEIEQQEDIVNFRVSFILKNYQNEYRDINSPS
jgi:hypothetical protein